MRSSNVQSNQIYNAQQMNLLGADATGGANLLAHQTLGLFSLGTNPTNGKTITLTINTIAVVITFVSAIGSTPGNVLIAGTAAGSVSNLLNLLANPQVTNANQVALSSANQTLVGYLDYDQSGGTLAVSSVNNLTYAPLTSFTAATNITGDTWTPSTMMLYVEDGICFINGVEVYFTGHMTPLVTAPVSHPRIDLLTIDNTGTLAWVTGVEGTSPATPAYPNNKLVICELWNVVGETQLLDNLNQSATQGFIYNDSRPFLTTPLYPLNFGSDFIPDGDGTRSLGSALFEWNNIYAKGGIFLNGVSINANLFTSAIAGQSLTAGKPVCILPYTAAQVTLDTSTSGTGSGTTVTKAFTVGANSNRVILVAISEVGSSGTVTGVTYNGVAMTQINTFISGALTGDNSTLWYLIAPATGANNVVITSSAANTVNYNIYSYYNCLQTSTPEANVMVTGTSGSASASLIPLTNGGLIFGMTAFNGTPTGGVFTNNTISNAVQTGDSGVLYPPSSQTMSVSGATNNCGVILISLAPAQVSPSPRVYLTSATQAITCASYIGIAQGSATAGNPVTIVTDGIDQNQSGLTIGTPYYLGNTPGTFSPSAGTVTRKAGIAVDTTKIVITNEW